MCLKVKTETLLWGQPHRRDAPQEKAACVCGMVVEERQRRGRKIETKADEGKVECALSDKQEHGSSLQGAPGEN